MTIPVIVPSNILIKSKVQINVHNDSIGRQIHGQIDTRQIDEYVDIGRQFYYFFIHLKLNIEMKIKENEKKRKNIEVEIKKLSYKEKNILLQKEVI